MSQLLSQCFSLQPLFSPFTWSTSATCPNFCPNFFHYHHCIGHSPDPPQQPWSLVLALLETLLIASSLCQAPTMIKNMSLFQYQKANKYPPDCIITVPSSKMINKMSIYFPFLRFIVTSISHKVSKSLIFMISFKAMMIEPPFLEMWPSREGPVKRL